MVACFTCGADHGGRFGVDAEGNRHCYACCGERDKASMIATGRAVMYWHHVDHYRAKVTNWPGTLEFAVRWPSASRHNFGGTLRTGRFVGPDGAVWSVRHVDSGWTQLAHCRRTKLKEV